VVHQLYGERGNASPRSFALHWHTLLSSPP
jgi:hypothetical protein